MLPYHIIVILNVHHLFPHVQLNLVEDAQQEGFVEQPKIGLPALQIIWDNSVIGVQLVKLNLAIWHQLISSQTNNAKTLCQDALLL